MRALSDNLINKTVYSYPHRPKHCFIGVLKRNKNNILVQKYTGICRKPCPKLLIKWARKYWNSWSSKIQNCHLSRTGVRLAVAGFPLRNRRGHRSRTIGPTKNVSS